MAEASRGSLISSRITLGSYGAGALVFFLIFYIALPTISSLTCGL